MEKRRKHRVPKRMTCAIEAGDKRSTGIVRDISEHGLFIQTSLAVDPDTLVHVVFPALDGEAEIRIEAGVARKRLIPRRLQASVPSGLGLEVIPPRNEFDRLVARLGRHSLSVSTPAGAAPRPDDSFAHRSAPPEDPIRAYRFRLIRRDRSEARVLTIRCATKAGARARALARVGGGWKIADVQPL